MRKLVSLLLVTILLAPQGLALSGNRTQVETDLAVEALLDEMSAEERVGQLFVITYQGTDVDADSEIAQLIQQYHIGGIILRAESDNFTAQTPLPQQVYNLTRNLQSLEASTDNQIGGVDRTPFIPLFIGIEHDGTGGITPELQSGLSPLASNMALGATWQPAYAEATGSILGEELAALGINLLIGPSADVVQEPRPSTTGDLATSEFGGDAFWVSKMAAAYVRGVHTGSDNRIAVFPRYFPGHGGADRVASAEIPSIQRTQDELIQTDLKPFFAVTGGAEDEESQAEGLLTGHIRFRGLQSDNALLATNPISLDLQNLPALLEIEQIATWRAEGGLIMSDALGVRGIAQYELAPNRQTPYRGIAQNALLAENDLLYLGKFDASLNINEAATIRDTITYLVTQYNLNPDVQTRVNEAVRRILRVKLDLYGADTFDLDEVIPSENGLVEVGTQSGLTFTIAKQALTLLSPTQVIDSPKSPDQIVIFTDSTLIQQCQTCPERYVIPFDALQSQILANYGPEATGDISFANIRSFRFDELQRYYQLGPQETPNDEGTPQANEVGVALNSADWVVFMMLNLSPNQTTSVVKEYLAGTPAENTVVFAMGAPYYLDATEVSKLTAYYALYGASAPSIEVAARALFLALNPVGSSPVSVNAIDYNIQDITYPDPNLPISLTFDCENVAQPISTPTLPLTLTPIPTSSETPCVPQHLDTIIVQTGVIRDKNGNPVPDGTPVQFFVTSEEQGLVLPDQVTTISGVAELRFTLDQIGSVEITAKSDPAILSGRISLEITEEGVTAEVQTVEPPSTTMAPVTETEEVLDPAAQVTPTAVATEIPTVPNVQFGDLYLSVFGLLFFAGIVFAYGYRERDINFALLLSLPVLVGGLLLYNYYAMLLPGTGIWRGLISERWAAALAAWLGGLLGLGLILFIVNGGLKWIRTVLRDWQRR